MNFIQHRRLTNWYIWRLIFVAFLAIFSIVTWGVANRDLAIGTDTQNYISFFNGALSESNLKGHEPLFELLTNIVAFAFNDYIYYLGVIFLLFNGFYLLAFYKFVTYTGLERDKVYLYFFFFFGLLFFSSWYLVATTNALRQGISLSFLYVSLLCFSWRKYIKFVFFFALSVGFHYAQLLCLPFIFLLLFRERYVWLVFVVLCFMYPLGLSDILVAEISRFLNLSLYEDIVSYAGEQAGWSGFHWNLYLYSIFWVIFFSCAQLFVQERWKASCYILLKIYMVLLMPYFAFGFGGFSNRYAFIAWLFLPFCQASYLVMLRIPLYVKASLAFVIFSVGLLNYAINIGLLM